MAMNMSEKTIINYRYQFKALASYFGAKDIVRIEDVTPDDIRGYISYMRCKGYAPDTIRDRFTGLATFFRFLCDDGLLIQNPTKNIVKPKLPKIPARTFTTTELQKMLSYYDEKTFCGLRNKLILYTLYGTGIRRNEILSLSVHDIRLDELNMVVIGKGSKQRIIPITPVLEKILRRYMRVRAELLLDLQVETSALIISKWGKPLTTSGLRELFKPFKELIGGKRLSCHTFRHSFAKNYIINAGGEACIFSLQRILGHESISTVRHYVNLSDREVCQEMKSFSPIENSKWSYLG